jgi:hypothetical protein
MIDRNIIINPTKPFDFFNDYTNTYHWLIRIGRISDAYNLKQRKEAYECDQQQKQQQLRKD